MSVAARQRLRQTGWWASPHTIAMATVSLCCCWPAVSAQDALAASSTATFSAAGCAAGPAYLGCYHDHDPSFENAEFKGARHLQWGVPGCSGWGGCGSPNHGRADCPPWPAGVEACTKGKITRAYCAQQCLLWSPAFVFSGVAFANECWCDAKQEALNINTLASESECHTPCVGNKNEICGGTWFTSVSECRAVPWGAPLLAVLLPCLALYVGGGVAYGRRLSGSTGSSLLKSHPHWSRWKEAAGLCADGIAFARGGGRRRAGSARTPLVPEGRDQGPRASQRKDKASKASSKRKSSHKDGGASKNEGKKQSRETSQHPDGAGIDERTAAGPKSAASGSGGRWVHVPT